jgi:predicted phosphoribosyltransferase
MDGFTNRDEAGRSLADAVRRRLGAAGPDERRLVLGLPRGGLPVAVHVARELDAPLDVLTVRKLGAPGHEELAMGAIASGGIQVLDRGLVDRLGVNDARLQQVVEREQAELRRREEVFREGREPLALAGATVVLVDDGVATGSTMKAAIDAVREAGAARIVVAIPLAPDDTLRELRAKADEVICLETPSPFWAVGQGYRDFPQVQDEEVRRILSEARERREGADGSA